MGRKKMAVEGGWHLDCTKLGGLVDETQVSVSDVLNHGTDKEVRHELDFIAAKIAAGGKPLNEPYRAYLVEALHRIAAGHDANKAFGLGRTGLSPSAVKGYMHLATQLRSQGMGATDAWSTVARLTPNLSGLGADTGAGRSLRDKVERAYKKIFGKLPPQK